jgi:hypothetical protein
VKFYRKKPVIVKAYQVTEPTKVRTIHGTKHADITDWVLTHTRGNKTVVCDDYFRTFYEPLYQGSEEE